MARRGFFVKQDDITKYTGSNQGAVADKTTGAWVGGAVEEPTAVGTHRSHPGGAFKIVQAIWRRLADGCEISSAGLPRCP